MQVYSEPCVHSIFSIALPCLVILHGNAYPSGDMWEHILPAATRLVRVYKEPRSEINNNTIKHVENQADIARIEVLIGMLDFWFLPTSTDFADLLVPRLRNYPRLFLCFYSLDFIPITKETSTTPSRSGNRHPKINRTFSILEWLIIL